MMTPIEKIRKYLDTCGWLFLQPHVMRLDLQLHAIVGLVMTIPLYAIPTYQIGWHKALGAFVALILSFAIAYTKEYLDSKKPRNKFDWLDLRWTVAGTAVGILLFLVFAI